MTTIPREKLIVARVLNEDNDFLYLEVLKDENGSFTIKENDHFLTLIFVRQRDDKGGVEAWKPWEEA